MIEALGSGLTWLEPDQLAGGGPGRLGPASPRLVGGPCPMGHDRLLAQSHHVFEVVGLLGGVRGPACDVLRVEHQWACGIVWTATEVELLRFVGTF